MIFINFKFIRRPTVSLETNTSEELQGGGNLSLSGLTGMILHVVLLMRLKVHLFDGGAFQHYQLYLSEGLRHTLLSPVSAKESPIRAKQK